MAVDERDGSWERTKKVRIEAKQGEKGLLSGIVSTPD